MGVHCLKRIGIWKASGGYFLGHNGKVISFKDVKQLTAFKKKYFLLYCGMRAPDGACYSRQLEESDKTIRYEDIDQVELAERNEWWRMQKLAENLAWMGQGNPFTQYTEKEEPYGPNYGISLD